MAKAILSAKEFHLDDPLMYILYAIIVAYIVALSLYYLISALKRAKALNMDMGKLKKVMSASASFSVLPALGIALGVVTLVGSLGVAFPAIRLSVIGSLQYETQMADGAATAMYGSLEALMNKGMSAQDMVTIASVMTVAICFGGIEVLLFYRKVQPEIGKLMNKTAGAGGGVNIGDVVFQVTFIGMAIGYLAMAITTIVTPGQIGFINSYYNFIAVIVAMITMYICDILIEKAGWKWLDNFATPLSMIIAMVVVGIISFCATKYGWAVKPEDVIVPVV